MAKQIWTIVSKLIFLNMGEKGLFKDGMLSAVPTENDVKYLIAKENNEKSLRNGISQPIASQTEIPPVGIAGMLYHFQKIKSQIGTVEHVIFERSFLA